MVCRRLYDLLNQPWVHGPRWWRAARYSKARARQLDAEHIAWAQELNTRRTVTWSHQVAGQAYAFMTLHSGYLPTADNQIAEGEHVGDVVTFTTPTGKERITELWLFQGPEGRI